MKRPLIGIPRAMYYYGQGSLWERFFKRLDCEVVFSPKTTSSILNDGTACAPSDACLPVKVFMGHVKYLDGKADCIFIPSCETLGKNAFCCPKFCALADMARHSVRPSAPIISAAVDVGRGVYGCGSLVRALGLPEPLVRRTIESVVAGGLEEGSAPVPVPVSEDSKIAVVGHPYVIYDPAVSMELTEKLERLGYRVITAQSTDRRERIRGSAPFAGKRFWSEGYDLLGASCALMSRPDVTGLIFVTSFACGIDAMVTDFVRKRIKAYPKVRFMAMSIDEHTGQAGFDTRLEAFLDILAVR